MKLLTENKNIESVLPASETPSSATKGIVEFVGELQEYKNDNFHFGYIRETDAAESSNYETLRHDNSEKTNKNDKYLRDFGSCYVGPSTAMSADWSPLTMPATNYNCPSLISPILCPLNPQLMQQKLQYHTTQPHMYNPMYSTYPYAKFYSPVAHAPYALVYNRPFGTDINLLTRMIPFHMSTQHTAILSHNQHPQRMPHAVHYFPNYNEMHHQNYNHTVARNSNVPCAQPASAVYSNQQQIASPSQHQQPHRKAFGYTKTVTVSYPSIETNSTDIGAPSSDIKLSAKKSGRDIFNNSLPQYFSLPRPMIWYMLEVINSELLKKKMYRTCKFFCQQIQIVENIFLLDKNTFQHIFDLTTGPKNIVRRFKDTECLRNRLWITRSLWLSCSKCFRMLMPKIYKCTIKILHLEVDNDFTLDDLKFFAQSNALVRVWITTTNREFLLENVLPLIPYATKICFKPCYLTKNTFKKLLHLEPKMKIQEMNLFELENLEHLENSDDVFNFLKQNLADNAKLGMFTDGSAYDDGTLHYLSELNDKIAELWTPKETMLKFRFSGKNIE